MSRRRDRADRLERSGESASSGPNPAEQVRGGVEALMAALESGGSQLPDAATATARDVLGKTARRLSFTGAHTVVALAGATGSGKSTLFNRLVGEEVSTAGQLRPTTSRITAAVWGKDSAADLLDWLDAPTRHHVEPSRRARPDDLLSMDGLVLLDLPDVDSHAEAHRAEADRVLQMCDVFVWVTDPQKYADALLHDEYLRRARHHQTVTLVVLNQADRMRSDQAKACRDDLRRLLTEDGLPDAEVLLVSARTGLGLEELATALGDAAKAATAARVRLLGDVRREANQLREHVADTEATLSDELDPELVDALGRSAGIPTIVRSVEADYLRQSSARTGWLFGRWVTLLRPDPLRRLGLEKPAKGDSDPAVDALQRSSLPQATPAARAAVDLTTRRLGTGAAVGLPPLWAQAIEDAATPQRDVLADALDQAVIATPLREKKPAWWTIFNLVQWVCGLAAVGGLVWLAVLAGFGYAQLPIPDVPHLGILPIPTLMVILGLLLGLLFALIARPLRVRGARRRRDRVQRQLHDQISTVARDHLLAPVRAVLGRHRGTREALELAAR